MIKTVFVDMDGVLSDFHKGVHNTFKKPYIYGPSLQRYDFWEDWDPITTRDDVNSICDFNFWRNLEWMHDGIEIIQAITSKFKTNQIYLLTTPMPNLESASGKMMWINNNLPIYLKRTIITQAPKSLLAKSDTLLIDDKDQNIDEFIKAGGRGLLVPRPWNRNYSWAHQSVDVVKTFLENLE